MVRLGWKVVVWRLWLRMLRVWMRIVMVKSRQVNVKFGLVEWIQLVKTGLV